jgi:hypothetical protein
MRAQQVRRHGYPRETQDVTRENSGDERQTAPHQRVFHRPAENAIASQRRR